jgi:hypothetical protein
MAAPRGFKAVANLDQLDDTQLVDLVLSNWHKLNDALKAGQSVETLQRLLTLELKRGEYARPNIAERIRSALMRALTQRSSEALAKLLFVLNHGGLNEQREKADREMCVDLALDLGLDLEQAEAIFYSAKGL